MVQSRETMTVAVAQFPHLKVFDRVLGLPVVELALAKSAQTYSRVKDSNQLMHWALATAEASVSIATKAVPIAAPIVKKFETPLSYVDRTLCFGLDKIEEKVPLVKETPNQVRRIVITETVIIIDKCWINPDQFKVINRFFITFSLHL